jgi:hypothetical protein
MRWEEGRRGEKVNRWGGMIMVGGGEDREEEGEGREGSIKRIGGGKGRAVIRMAFS